MTENQTDPYILHDPMIDVGKIAIPYEPENAIVGREKDGAVGAAHNYDGEKTYGVLWPVVQINKRVIFPEQIEKCVLYYDELLPRIMIKIFDRNAEIQALDVPGLNNIMRIVLVPSIKNTYKSIKLAFNIDSVKIDGDIVTYFGSYYLNTLKKEYTKEIVYPGCSSMGGKRSGNNETAKETYACNTAPQKQPNTWEYLHVIAHETGLGFMSTDKCQDVEDRMPRLMSNEKYPEFIKKHMRFGGLDEHSIFDCWVDLYGYLVLINVSWIFEEEINHKDLKIYAARGGYFTGHDTPPPTAERVDRVISNFSEMGVPNNMMFENYKTIVNNSDLTYGTMVSQYTFNLAGVKPENVNACTQSDVRVVQQSLDGLELENYRTEKLRECCIEFNQLPINKQRNIRDKFFTKHRERILEIQMSTPNLGLQRGTLISVIIFEYNKAVISQLTDQYQNVVKPGNETEPFEYTVDNVDLDERQLKLNENMHIPNPALSGIYYIDGMRFEYSKYDHEFIQYLLLIKKGNLSNIDNFANTFRTKNKNLRKLLGSTN